MAKNVQGVIFLRNNSVYENRELALTGIESKKSLVGDGQFILARYNATEGNDTVVKTLVGIKAGDGANGYLTIIDVEGASADVEKLRREINAKLGEGITSANTATAQLAALSGGTFTPGTSSSAATSVEGAKAYAYDLVGTLDGGVTAETGYFVKSVSEVDGKISGTTEALPSYDDTAVAKKFVIAVDETNGKIAVTRGEVTSTDKTVALTDGADGGIDLAVNIDGVTLEKDADTGVISVASAALTQYVGDEDTIHISDVDTTTNTKTVSSLLTISATTPTETNVKEQYNLVGANGNTIGATIKIYKDSSLYNVYLGHVDDTIAGDPPVVTPGTGDAALCFIYHKEDGSYELVPVNVESFLEESEFESGVTATNHIVHGVVDSTSEKDSNNDPFLTVGADGFKVDGIKDEIAAQLGDVVAGLDATVSGVTSGSHITLKVEELDGKLVQSGFSITEDNIADADDLAALSAKTVTEIASSNESIAVSTATTTADDGTVKYDIITDADKIQMSGFSADNTSALSGIAESDSIATAFEKANAVITDNERVTAAALTDLDGRLDVIESGYVETVKVNNVALTETDNAVNVQISAATSVPTATVSDPAIVVNTDNTGAITLGIGYIDCGTYDD